MLDLWRFDLPRAGRGAPARVDRGLRVTRRKRCGRRSGWARLRVVGGLALGPMREEAPLQHDSAAALADAQAQRRCVIPQADARVQVQPAVAAHGPAPTIVRSICTRQLRCALIEGLVHQRSHFPPISRLAIQAEEALAVIFVQTLLPALPQLECLYI